MKKLLYLKHKNLEPWAISDSLDSKQSLTVHLTGKSFSGLEMTIVF